MMRTPFQKIINIWLTTALLVQMLILPDMVVAQEEVASALRRFKDREASTGYYEEYEVLPRRQQPLISIPGVRKGTFPYSPTAARVRIRTRLADSHQGIKFYTVLRCEFCHAKETKDIHRVRANLTCRQCHGGEPIASIEHFYSPLNPIRRHAYVCAKCHEGASASFASYVVHEPAAGSLAAKDDFPILYYSYWFIFLLLVGTLAFFIPHTLLVGVRELIAKARKTKKDEGELEAEPKDIESIDEHDDRHDDEQGDEAKKDEPRDEKRDDKHKD